MKLDRQYITKQDIKQVDTRRGRGGATDVSYGCEFEPEAKSEIVEDLDNA